MKQSVKHRIFDGISWNLLKICTSNSKFLEGSPNGLGVILVKFEDDIGQTSPDITCSGKHGTSRGFFLIKVLKLILYCSKRSEYTFLWVGGSLEMWLSWYETIFFEVLKLILDCSKLLQIYLSMVWRIVGHCATIPTQFTHLTCQVSKQFIIHLSFCFFFKIIYTRLWLQLCLLSGLIFDLDLDLYSAYLRTCQSTSILTKLVLDLSLFGSNFVIWLLLF